MLVTLDAKELLAAARLAYDKDQIRSWAKCVLIKVRRYKYTIVGSDGYKLIEFEHNLDCDAADVSKKYDADFLIYIEEVKKYVKSTDSAVIIDYNSDADDLTAHVYEKKKSGNMLRDIVKFHNLSKFNWEYIDYKSIIETQRENDGTAHQGYSAWVNADYMSDICAAVKLTYGKDTPIQIMLGYEGRAMEFMTSDYNNMRTCFGMVMPVRR